MELSEKKAINAKQIKLTFNKSVTKESALNVTNYSIKPTSASAITLATSGNYAATADFGEDSKTVIITLAKALTTTGAGNWAVAEGDVFNFNYDVKSTANDSLKGTTTVKYSDKVAPKFVSATAAAKTTTNQVVLKFSEPVDYSQATVTINGAYASLSAGTTPDQVIATTTSNLEAGKSYDATILNIKDAAGNLLADNNLKTTFTVSSDVVAPVVSDVKVVRDNLLEVTFDKAVNVASLNTAGNVKVLDANSNSVATVGTITAKPYTSGKTVRVPLTGINFNDAGTLAANLVLTDGVLDTAGNKLASTSKAFSLSKDTTAPTVVSSTYVNKATYNGLTTTNGAIVVKFSKDIDSATLATAVNYTVVDNEGATVTFTGTPAVNPNDSTELVLPLSGAVAAGTKSYKVVLPKNAVKDLTSQANGSASVNLTVDVSSGAVVASDVTAPVVASVTPVAATTTAPNKFRVAFTEADSGLDNNTVTDVNNYRLNGSPLPSGSYITVSSTTATIILPTASISESKNYTLNVTGVKDKAGNTMSESVTSGLALVDDIAPTLNSAVLNTNGTLSLGFSEVLGATAATDFTVTINGTVVPGSQLTLTPGIGAEAGKQILSVKTSVDNVADGSEDGVLKDYLYIDVDGTPGYNSANDILVASKIATADSTNDNYVAGTYDLTKATTVKVSTIASPVTTKDTSSINNKIVGSKTITVK